MSQTTIQLEDLEMGNGGGDDYLEQPRSVASLTPQGEPQFPDSSGALWSMYLKFAEEERDKMAEHWAKDADGILIFAGLFSAVVATLLSVTIQDLKPSPQPQGNSEFYLKNICLSISQKNELCEPAPSLVTDSFSFSPPKSAIWVNSLWFLSLVISLTYAMLATLIPKWSRRNIRIKRNRRARVRAFFSDGVDKWHVSLAAGVLATLPVFSLILFFVGLSIYLFSTNHLVFVAVVWWMVLFMIAYLSITFLPLFQSNSPYYAPLSLPIWYIYARIRYTFFKVLSCL